MTVSPVPAATAANPGQQPSPASAAAKASTDFDTFLALLTTQLRNQDPTSPADSTELVAQLANFSSVEQQIKTNDKLDTLIASLSGANYSNLLGKWLSSADNLVSGQVAAIKVENGTAVAVLTDDKTVDLGAGYRLSESKPAGS